MIYPKGLESIVPNAFGPPCPDIPVLLCCYLKEHAKGARCYVRFLLSVRSEFWSIVFSSVRADSWWFVSFLVSVVPFEILVGIFVGPFKGRRCMLCFVLLCCCWVGVGFEIGPWVDLDIYRALV